MVWAYKTNGAQFYACLGFIPSTLCLRLDSRYTQPMKDDGLDEESFGEILSTMLAAGASNDVVGRFAIMFRNKNVAQLRPAEVEMGPVLEAFASEVASKVLRGVAGAAASASLGAGTGIGGGPQAKAKPQSIGSKIMVISVKGQRTSVSINKDLFAQAMETLGGLPKVKEAVKRYAAEAPSEKRRSAYVQAMIRAQVESAGLLSRTGSNSSPMH